MLAASKQLIIASLVMFTDAKLALGASPIDLDPTVVLVREFGFPIALIIFFVWETYRRESRMAKRIDTLETFQRDQMVGLIKETNHANSALAVAIMALTEKMSARPCFAIEDARERLASLEAQSLQARLDHIKQEKPNVPDSSGTSAPKGSAEKKTV